MKFGDGFDGFWELRRSFLLRCSHLPNCCACCRASTRLKLPSKLNCSMLRMSHALCARVERREKIRHRFVGLGLFVLIGVLLFSDNTDHRKPGAEAVVRFAYLAPERDRTTPFEG